MIGTTHLLRSRIDDAVLWFEKGRSVSPDVPVIRGRLASAYALRGETQRAATELTEAHRLAGEVFSSIAGVRAAASFGVPRVRALFEATYFAGLRLAGMPEE